MCNRSKLTIIPFLALIAILILFNNACVYSQNKKSSIKRDSLYQLPFITIHAGIGFISPKVQFKLDSDIGESGTNLNLRRDLSHPGVYILPKINAMIALTDKYQITSDIFFASIQERFIGLRDIQFGNHLFHANSHLHGRYSIYAGNVSYIYRVVKNYKYNVGVLFGLSGGYTSLSIQDENTHQKKEKTSLVLLTPIGGMDVYGFLTPKLFYRLGVKFIASPFKNYSYSYFSFKPYIEYHFHKNIGLGLRFDYLNLSVKDISRKTPNQTLNAELPVISLIGIFRFFRK